MQWRTVKESAGPAAHRGGTLVPPAGRRGLRGVGDHPATQPDRRAQHRGHGRRLRRRDHRGVRRRCGHRHRLVHGRPDRAVPRGEPSRQCRDLRRASCSVRRHRGGQDLVRRQAAVVASGDRTLRGLAAAEEMLPGRRLGWLRRLLVPLAARMWDWQTGPDEHEYFEHDYAIESDAVVRFDSRQALPRIRGPVLLINGDRDRNYPRTGGTGHLPTACMSIPARATTPPAAAARDRSSWTTSASDRHPPAHPERERPARAVTETRDPAACSAFLVVPRVGRHEAKWGRWWWRERQLAPPALVDGDDAGAIKDDHSLAEVRLRPEVGPGLTWASAHSWGGPRLSAQFPLDQCTEAALDVARGVRT